MHAGRTSDAPRREVAGAVAASATREPASRNGSHARAYLLTLSDAFLSNEGHMARIVVTWLGTFASVGGLAVALWPETGMISATQGAVLGVVAAILFAGVSADFVQYIRHRPKRYKTTTQINDYMYRWISTGGRVAIFTRDMR